MEVFSAQLDIANETGVPLVIHCRDAEQDVLDLMAKVFIKKFVLSFNRFFFVICCLILETRFESQNPFALFYRRLGNREKISGSFCEFVHWCNASHHSKKRFAEWQQNDGDCHQCASRPNSLRDRRTLFYTKNCWSEYNWSQQFSFLFPLEIIIESIYWHRIIKSIKKSERFWFYYDFISFLVKTTFKHYLFENG